MNAQLSHITASEWHRGYRLSVEIGFVLSLLVIIGFFHLPLDPGGGFDATMVQQETVSIEEILQTHQVEQPPPPPRAMIPILVPDESLPDEEELNLDAALDLEESLIMPSAPPPPPVKKEEKQDDEKEIFVVVEEMPTVIGGIEQLYKVIEYPEIARQAGMEGMVIVEFIVMPDGTPNQPIVRRTAGEVLDRAAVEAVMKLRFTPGRQRGKPVMVRFSIPVRFRLKEPPR